MKKSCLVLVLLVLACAATAQSNEPINSSINDYLYRMAQKGLVKLDDYILPLNRTDIALLINELHKKSSSLSNIEKSELSFYDKEFHFDVDNDSLKDSKTFLAKDEAGRFRALQIKNGKTSIFLDPIFGTSFSKYKSTYNFTFYTGGRVWGNIGKNIGFTISFWDVNENGDSINANKTFTPETGIVNTSPSVKRLNYSNLNFNINYRWKNGLLSIGKDNQVWGYGAAGNIVMSTKTPSFTYVRLDYKPFKWLYFNYIGGGLSSDIIDSSRSYNTGAAYRIVYRPKFIANHSLTFKPWKNLDISIGESIIYSDRFDVGYLIPINFFKAYDQYVSKYSLTAGSNSQFFGQISSRNHIKNTHIYLTYFIDEISMTGLLFDKTKKRNQLGYTFGINKTDLFLHYLTAGIEYTRINPFVYDNLIPAQTYQNSSYNIGDWMGNNADRLYVFVKYTPKPRLKIEAWGQSIRKGGMGTVHQQYSQPQPEFLFDRLFDQKSFGINISYEAINKLVFGIDCMSQQTNYYQLPYTSRNYAMAISMRYGL